MYLFINYWVLFNVVRIYGISRSTFLWLYCSITGLLLIPRVFFDALGLPIFALLMGAAALSEIVVSIPASVGWLGRRSRLRVRRGWLWFALGVYTPAFIVWRLSGVGEPLCDPPSLIQGHALWHVLTALSPGALYLYFLRDQYLDPHAA